MTPIETILARIPGAKKSGKNWSALCPAHDDRTPSLSVSEGRDGRALVKCHAGCTLTAILTALNLTARDLMPDPGTPSPKRTKKPAGRFFSMSSDAVTALERQHGPHAQQWSYHTADGELAGVVVRWNLSDGGKDIRPVARLGDGWRIGAMPEPRLLYMLPKLATAKLVIVTEGEKAADAAHALGFTATTSAGGAQVAAKTDWQPLAGKTVWILPDHDAPGRKYAADVVTRLAALNPAPVVKVLTLPGLPEHGDIVDWIDAHGDAAEPAALREEIEQLAAGSAPSNHSGHRPAAHQPVQEEADAPTAVVYTASTLAALPVEWLWTDYIPKGAITVLDGDPGLGKSTLTAELAARVSRGWSMPPLAGGEMVVPPADVLLLNAEDDMARTIRQRLEAAGADLERVHILHAIKDGDTERPPVLPGDLRLIEDNVTHRGVALVVVDPLMAYFGRATDTHKDADVRAVLHQLMLLAERTRAAVLVVRHLNKLGGGAAIYRGGGSIGIVGAARSALLVGKHPAEPHQRVLAPVKCNLCRMPPALAFAHETAGDTNRVAWLGVADYTADDLLTAPTGSQRGELTECTTALADILSEGDATSKDVERRLTDMGYSERTIQRARKQLNVKPVRVGGSKGRWVLRLHRPEDPLPE